MVALAHYGSQPTVAKDTLPPACVLSLLRVKGNKVVKIRAPKP